MRGTRIEMEVEICVRNLADKNQVDEYQCEDMGKIVKTCKTLWLESYFFFQSRILFPLSRSVHGRTTMAS
jgi:hypothetical protein